MPVPGCRPRGDGLPWDLSPLVAQVTAAWLLSFAVAAVLAVREDVRLLGPAGAGYLVFGAVALLVAVLHRGEKPERVKVPDFAHLLPEPIRRFTTRGVYDADETQHLSFIQGSGHGGSHPHLAHEFISAIVEDREPRPNVVTSANWTLTGICAHQSAMKGGERVAIPQF